MPPRVPGGRSLLSRRRPSRRRSRVRPHAAVGGVAYEPPVQRPHYVVIDDPLSPPPPRERDGERRQGADHRLHVRGAKRGAHQQRRGPARLTELSAQVHVPGKLHRIEARLDAEPLQTQNRELSVARVELRDARSGCPATGIDHRHHNAIARSPSRARVGQRGHGAGDQDRGRQQVPIEQVQAQTSRVPQRPRQAQRQHGQRRVTRRRKRHVDPRPEDAARLPARVGVDRQRREQQRGRHRHNSTQLPSAPRRPSGRTHGNPTFKGDAIARQSLDNARLMAAFEPPESTITRENANASRPSDCPPARERERSEPRRIGR